MIRQEILFEKGYQVLITQSNENFETELKNVKALEDSMVDGIIISQSSESKNVDYFQNLIHSDLHVFVSLYKIDYQNLILIFYITQ